MIIPLGDDNRDRTTRPVVTYILIAINILVFVFLQDMGNNYNFTYAYSTVPQEIISGHDVVTQDRVVLNPVTGQRFRSPGLRPTPIPVYLTIITAMFMHGSIMHILGNMLFLFIFGDNIEDRMGRMRYLLFYLVCGVLASLAHVYSSVALNANLEVPSLGASGAISGVLAGYLVLFPRKRVRVIILRIFANVPAVVAIGVWFLFQLVFGLASVGGSGGGVAYGAHIGGFIAGLVLVKPFAARRRTRA